MNPEQFHDALNHLDDELIAETDELRQGAKVRRKPLLRKIGAWAACAACMVLILGLGPRLLSAALDNGRAGATNGNMEAEAPAQQIMDQIWGGAEVSVEQSQSEYFMEGVSCGGIYIELPQTWEHEIVKEDGGGYFLHIRPPHEEGYVRLGYWPGFAVCGTGLTQDKTVIAGMEATVGTYDGNGVWSFITFGGDYVAVNEGADAWWEARGDLFMKCLETLVISDSP